MFDVATIIEVISWLLSKKFFINLPFFATRGSFHKSNVSLKSFSLKKAIVNECDYP